MSRLIKPPFLQVPILCENSNIGKTRAEALFWMPEILPPACSERPNGSGGCRSRHISKSASSGSTIEA